jgi:hypothetical protein
VLPDEASAGGMLCHAHHGRTRAVTQHARLATNSRTRMHATVCRHAHAHARAGNTGWLGGAPEAVGCRGEAAAAGAPKRQQWPAAHGRGDSKGSAASVTGHGAGSLVFGCHPKQVPRGGGGQSQVAAGRGRGAAAT